MRFAFEQTDVGMRLEGEGTKAGLVASIVAVPKVANTVESVKPAGVRSIRNQRNGLTSASVRVNWRGEDQGSLRWKEILALCVRKEESI